MKTFTSSINETGTISFFVDDYCTAYVNGVNIGAFGGGIVHQRSVNILAGSNTIIFYATNGMGPAGIIASLSSTNNYIVTDYSWEWTTGKSSYYYYCNYIIIITVIVSNLSNMYQ